MERRINGPDAELLSPEDAARWLGIPVTTWKAWVRQGLVPSPRSPNKAVQFYGWDEVVAMRTLLQTGFLPLVPSQQTPPPEAKRTQ